jgi:mRNA-degrading endonuclease toxin of MazEF toxin-antitoxin module
MSTPLPMTKGRRLALLLGVPIALALIAWTGLTEVAYAGLGSYPVRLAVQVHGSTVSLSTSAADVQVTQAPGSTLRLTGKARYSLVRSTVTWHATPSGVIVSPRCHFFIGDCSFSFHAVLPAGKRAVLSDGSGNLTLRGLTGPVSVGSGSGDVQANLLSGTVSLQTGSGNITGSALAGPKVTLKAGSGNIAIDSLASLDVVVSDGSGNIALTFSKVPTRVQVSNSSGNISVVLPPGPTHYQVNGTTSSGNRTVSVPITTGSAHVITVSDGSGNVSVTN